MMQQYLKSLSLGKDNAYMVVETRLGEEERSVGLTIPLGGTNSSLREM